MSYYTKEEQKKIYDILNTYYTESKSKLNVATDYISYDCEYSSAKIGELEFVHFEFYFDADQYDVTVYRVKDALSDKNDELFEESKISSNTILNTIYKIDNENTDKAAEELQNKYSKLIDYLKSIHSNK